MVTVERIIKWGLILVGLAGVAAIFPALMPRHWFVEASSYIGLEFPQLPLGYFLGRQLSLLYVVFGSMLLVVATDVKRYRPLLQAMVYLLIAAGTIQLWIDYSAEMPVWWTAIEGTRTVVGGILLAILLTRCKPLCNRVE